MIIKFSSICFLIILVLRCVSLADDNSQLRQLSIGIGQNLKPQINYSASQPFGTINSEPAKDKTIVFNDSQALIVEYRLRMSSDSRFGIHTGIAYDFIQKSKMEYLASANFEIETASDQNSLSTFTFYAMPMFYLGPFYITTFPLPGLVLSNPNIKIPNNTVSGYYGWIGKIGFTIAHMVNIDFTVRNHYLTIKDDSSGDSQKGTLSVSTLLISYNF